eukprot:tig00001339_g8271.t1
MEISWERTLRLRSWGQERVTAIDATVFAALVRVSKRWRTVIQEHLLDRRMALLSASDWDARNLARLRPELDTLCLPSCCLSRAGMEHLREIHVEGLEVSVALQHVTKLAPEPLLEALPGGLRRLSFEMPEAAQYGCRAVALSRILTPASLATIGALERLEVLRLCCLPVAPQLFGALAGQLAPRLRELAVSFLVTLRDAGAMGLPAAFAALGQLARLERLTVGFVGAEGVETAAAPALPPADLAQLRPLAGSLAALSIGAPLLDAGPLAALGALRELDVELAPGPPPRPSPPSPSSPSPSPAPPPRATRRGPLGCCGCGCRRGAAGAGGEALGAWGRLRRAELEAAEPAAFLPRRFVAALAAAPALAALRLRSPCRLFSAGAPAGALAPLARLRELEVRAPRGDPFLPDQLAAIRSALPAARIRFR